MKKNVGNIDRLLRAIIGILLISLTLSGIIGAWGWIGIIPLLSALFSFCPLYTLIGINTCKTR